MENAVDVVEVLPYKPAHLIVVRDRLESAVNGLVASCGPLDATIIHKGPCNIRDFRLEDEGDVLMEYCTSIRPTLRQAGQLNCAYGGLDSG
jgi:hypothetical protein